MGHVQYHSRHAFPAGGASLLAQDVADWGDANLRQGNDVIVSQLCQPVFDFGGVVDIVDTFVGTAPSPTESDNIVITNREIADLDTARIVINIV